MPKLADILLTDTRRPALASDCVSLIENHVAGRQGLRGMGLRTGLSMLQAAKPGILPRAVNRLLPDFVAALEPLYTQFKESGAADFSLFLDQRQALTTGLLLGVADRKAAESHNETVKATYKRLRGGAEKEVAAVVPALGALLGKHLGLSAKD